MNRSKQLKDLLTAKETLVMPDAYDPISAAVNALLQSMDALKAGVFTRLAAAGRLCSSQDIGRLIDA